MYEKMASNPDIIKIYYPTHSAELKRIQSEKTLNYWL